MKRNLPTQRPGTGRVALLCLLLCASASVWCTGVQAHHMRTAHLQLTEQRVGRAIATWHATAPDHGVVPLFPARCKVQRRVLQRTPVVRAYKVSCPAPFAGSRVRVAGLGPTLSEVVVRVRFVDGRIASGLLTPYAPSWKMPLSPSRTRAFSRYITLGFRHLYGLPTIFLLLGFLLLAQTPSTLTRLIALFVLGHGITLASVALGLLPPRPTFAKACIAWATVLIAWEVIRHASSSRKQKQLALWLGFFCGLAHGFAPSAVLTHNPIFAFFGFHVGITGSILALLLVCAAGYGFLRRILRPKTLRPLLATITGTLGIFWLLQHLAPMLS